MKRKNKLVPNNLLNPKTNSELHILKDTRTPTISKVKFTMLGIQIGNYQALKRRKDCPWGRKKKSIKITSK